LGAKSGGKAAMPLPILLSLKSISVTLFLFLSDGDQGSIDHQESVGVSARKVC